MASSVCMWYQLEAERPIGGLEQESKQENRPKREHAQRASKTCLCKKTEPTGLVPSNPGVRIPLVWGSWWMVVPITWMGKVNNFLGSSIQYPPFPATSYLLVLSWSVHQFLQTLQCFWPLASNGSLIGSQSYQDGGPIKTSHVTSGFPCCKSRSQFGGKVHLSQNGYQPFKSREPIDIWDWAAAARQA